MHMKKLFRFLLAVAIVFCLLCVAGVTLDGYRLYRDALSQQSLSDKVTEVRAQTNYTTLDEVPENYVNAIIAVEDRRFWLHGGVDVISIGRAAWNNLLAKDFAEGGSTITQQLAKNLYFTQEKRFVRKIAEAFMALHIESQYSKEEILELYINSIYFGDGYYCVRDAALGYFGKEPAEMDLSECTMLAGIPNAPSVYSPTKNPDLAQQRQQDVLRCMVKYGYLTQDEADRVTAPTVVNAAA
jgi:membrane peptidoglycan carboxypeptidase